jgi:MFS family permease
MMALIVSNSSILFYSFGVFLKPISWSRGGMSLALSATMIATVIGAPIAGKLFDHLGIKRVMPPAIIVFSLSFSAASLTSASLFTFIAIYSLVGLIAAANSPLPYAKVISSQLNARRGLALVLANIGTGLGAAVVPPLAAWLVETGGVKSTDGGTSIHGRTANAERHRTEADF